MNTKEKFTINFKQILLLFLIFFAFSQLVEARPESFYQGKKEMYNVFTGNETTFYCGCSYKDKKVDLQSCGYKVRKSEYRALRTEAEHVVPAHRFGKDLPCWKEGGRKLCSKIDKKFKLMEGDLFNLRPAIGEVNGDRRNFEFGIIPGEERKYGACDVEIDFELNLIEPRPEIRGDIARVYIYMNIQYGMHLSEEEKQMFLEWAYDDPIDDDEHQWIKRVTSIMQQ